MSQSTARNPRSRPNVDELLDFIAAVGEAIDIPEPVNRASKRYRETLDRRAFIAALAIRGVVTTDPYYGDPQTVRERTARLRKRLAEIPTTGYRHDVPSGGAS